jgi:hypothetical protein
MQQQDVIFKLSNLANRFPRGLELSKQDRLFVGWLYFRELATETARISDRELRQQLSHAAVQLGMEDDVSQPAQVIDRLVRFRMVRTSVTDSRAAGVLPDPAWAQSGPGPLGRCGLWQRGPVHTPKSGAFFAAPGDDAGRSG